MNIRKIGPMQLGRHISKSEPLLSASLYFSKEALIEIGCAVTSLVVGWLVVTRVHCGQTVHPRSIVTMEH